MRGIMSELDDLKNDAERYAKDHPQQVQAGEEDLERKLVPGEAQGSQSAGGGQEGHPEDAGDQQDPAGGQQDPAGGQQGKGAADRDSAASQ
jgi:hypothetical protein